MPSIFCVLQPSALRFPWFRAWPCAGRKAFGVSGGLSLHGPRRGSDGETDTSTKSTSPFWPWFQYQGNHRPSQLLLAEVFFLCVRIRIRRDSPLLTPLFHHTFLLSQLSSPLASIHPIGNRYQITTRINPQNGEVGSFTVRISQMSRPFCIQISCQPMNGKIWDCRN